jgi:hypothetical protein
MEIDGIFKESSQNSGNYLVSDVNSSKYSGEKPK